MQVHRSSAGLSTFECWREAVRKIKSSRLKRHKATDNISALLARRPQLLRLLYMLYFNRTGKHPLAHVTPSQTFAHPLGARIEIALRPPSAHKFVRPGECMRETLVVLSHVLLSPCEACRKPSMHETFCVLRSSVGVLQVWTI